MGHALMLSSVIPGVGRPFAGSISPFCGSIAETEGRAATNLRVLVPDRENGKLDPDSPYDTEVEIHWDAPQDSSVNRITLEWRHDGLPGWTKLLDAAPLITKFKQKDLLSRRDYEFRVVTFNSPTSSTPSASVDYFVPLLKALEVRIAWYWYTFNGFLNPRDDGYEDKYLTLDATYSYADATGETHGKSLYHQHIDPVLATESAHGEGSDVDPGSTTTFVDDFLNSEPTAGNLSFSLFSTTEKHQHFPGHPEENEDKSVSENLQFVLQPGTIFPAATADYPKAGGLIGTNEGPGYLRAGRVDDLLIGVYDHGNVHEGAEGSAKRDGTKTLTDFYSTAQMALDCETTLAGLMPADWATPIPNWPGIRHATFYGSQYTQWYLYDYRVGQGFASFEPVSTPGGDIVASRSLDSGGRAYALAYGEERFLFNPPAHEAEALLVETFTPQPTYPGGGDAAAAVVSPPAETTKVHTVRLEEGSKASATTPISSTAATALRPNENGSHTVGLLPVEMSIASKAGATADSDLLPSGQNLTPGGYVPINANNDNGSEIKKVNGVPTWLPEKRDFDADHLPKDDEELVRLKLSVPHSLPFTARIRIESAGRARVKLWKDRRKNELFLASGQVDKPFAELPDELWVEGVKEGEAERDVTLFLEIVAGTQVSEGGRIKISVTPILQSYSSATIYSDQPQFGLTSFGGHPYLWCSVTGQPRNNVWLEANILRKNAAGTGKQIQILDLDNAAAATVRTLSDEVVRTYRFQFAPPNVGKTLDDCGTIDRFPFYINPDLPPESIGDVLRIKISDSPNVGLTPVAPQLDQYTEIDMTWRFKPLRCFKWVTGLATATPSRRL